LIIYHHPCTDGFTAAWIAYSFFNGECDLHRGRYQTDPPDVIGREVYILDFSYPREVLEKMAEKAEKIVLLDHHSTAYEELKNWVGVPRSVPVPLSGGEVAWVDESDFDLVSSYSWSKAKHGGAYAYLGGGRENRKRGYMHQLILPVEEKDLMVDHINRNTLDNRRINLRKVTRQQNAFNMDRGSKWKGVTRSGDRWRAQITVDRKNHHLGSFGSPEEAARAYDEAAKQRFGEYARLNFDSTSAPCPHNVHIIFDQDRSGAALAWLYFYRAKPMPWLVLYVEDRDLYRFDLQDSKAISLWIKSFPYDLATWDQMCAWLDTPAAREEAADQGKTLSRMHDLQVAEHASKRQKIRIGGHVIWAANCSEISIVSDLVQKLAEKTGLGASWVTIRGHALWRLTSDGSLHVGELAKRLGGGGHPKAAGFKISLERHAMILAGWDPLYPGEAS
tara:strand:+ start:2323 stop:3663 length:1341 start_codon:yes stop_codon:yes gene_type:complete